MEGSEAPEGAERSDLTWECVKLELVWLIYVNDKKETVSHAWAMPFMEA